MRARVLLVLLASALALAAIASAAPVALVRVDDPETARIRREVERLRSEREVASGKGFYLRLDASRPGLALMLQGVTLDDYAASGVAWGVPEVFFVDRKPAADWDAVAFSKGRLEPARSRDRLEVLAPPPAAAAATGSGPEAPSPSPPPPPKSAEESYSVPSPYRIVFAENVSLEIRSKGEGGRNRSAWRRFADAVSLRVSDLGTALGIGAKERVRLRVTLEAEDAASLYRSLPPDVRLVVVGFPER
jgi:hypothetical protein